MRNRSVGILPPTESQCLVIENFRTQYKNYCDYYFRYLITGQNQVWKTPWITIESSIPQWARDQEWYTECLSVQLLNSGVEFEHSMLELFQDLWLIYSQQQNWLRLVESKLFVLHLMMETWQPWSQIKQLLDNLQDSVSKLTTMELNGYNSNQRNAVYNIHYHAAVLSTQLYTMLGLWDSALKCCDPITKLSWKWTLCLQAPCSLTFRRIFGIKIQLLIMLGKDNEWISLIEFLKLYFSKGASSLQEVQNITGNYSHEYNNRFCQQHATPDELFWKYLFICYNNKTNDFPISPLVNKLNNEINNNEIIPKCNDLTFTNFIQCFNCTTISSQQMLAMDLSNEQYLAKKKEAQFLLALGNMWHYVLENPIKAMYFYQQCLQPTILRYFSQHDCNTYFGILIPNNNRNKANKSIEPWIKAANKEAQRKVIYLLERYRHGNFYHHNFMSFDKYSDFQLLQQLNDFNVTYHNKEELQLSLSFNFWNTCNINHVVDKCQCTDYSTLCCNHGLSYLLPCTENSTGSSNTSFASYCYHEVMRLVLGKDVTNDIICSSSLISICFNMIKATTITSQFDPEFMKYWTVLIYIVEHRLNNTELISGNIEWIERLCHYMDTIPTDALRKRWIDLLAKVLADNPPMIILSSSLTNQLLQAILKWHDDWERYDRTRDCLECSFKILMNMMRYHTSLSIATERQAVREVLFEQKFLPNIEETVQLMEAFNAKDNSSWSPLTCTIIQCALLIIDTIHLTIPTICTLSNQTNLLHIMNIKIPSIITPLLSVKPTRNGFLSRILTKIMKEDFSFFSNRYESLSISEERGYLLDYNFLIDYNCYVQCLPGGYRYNSNTSWLPKQSFLLKQSPYDWIESGSNGGLDFISSLSYSFCLGEHNFTNANDNDELKKIPLVAVEVTLPNRSQLELDERRCDATDLLQGLILGGHAITLKKLILRGTIKSYLFGNPFALWLSSTRNLQHLTLTHSITCEDMICKALPYNFSLLSLTIERGNDYASSIFLAKLGDAFEAMNNRDNGNVCQLEQLSLDFKINLKGYILSKNSHYSPLLLLLRSNSFPSNWRQIPSSHNILSSTERSYDCNLPKLKSFYFPMEYLLNHSHPTFYYNEIKLLLKYWKELYITRVCNLNIFENIIFGNYFTSVIEMVVDQSVKGNKRSLTTSWKGFHEFRLVENMLTAGYDEENIGQSLAQLLTRLSLFQIRNKSGLTKYCLYCALNAMTTKKLYSFAQLKALEVSGIQFDSTITTYFNQLLETHHFPNLTDLIISHASMSSVQLITFLQTMVNTNDTLLKLKKVNFSFNKLDHESIRWILQLIMCKKYPDLQLINLQGNNDLGTTEERVIVHAYSQHYPRTFLLGPYIQSERLSSLSKFLKFLECHYCDAVKRLEFDNGDNKPVSLKLTVTIPTTPFTIVGYCLEWWIRLLPFMNPLDLSVCLDLDSEFLNIGTTNEIIRFMTLCIQHWRQYGELWSRYRKQNISCSNNSLLHISSGCRYVINSVILGDRLMDDNIDMFIVNNIDMLGANEILTTLLAYDRYSPSCPLSTWQRAIHIGKNIFQHHRNNSLVLSMFELLRINMHTSDYAKELMKWCICNILLCCLEAEPHIAEYSTVMESACRDLLNEWTIRQRQCYQQGIEFDVLEDEALIGYHLIRYKIHVCSYQAGGRRPLSLQFDDSFVRFMLMIPSIRELIPINICTRLRQRFPFHYTGQGSDNMLLQYARELNNTPAMLILSRVTDTRLERVTIMNNDRTGHGNNMNDDQLQRLVTSTESSMTALNIREEGRLTLLMKQYENEWKAKGSKNIIEDLIHHLKQQYEANPVIIKRSVIDKNNSTNGKVSLKKNKDEIIRGPLTWEELNQLKTSQGWNEHQFATVCSIYHNHSIHTAWRYFQKPNHWISSNARHLNVYTTSNGERTQWRYSSFEDYQDMIAILYLAVIDNSMKMNNVSIDDRFYHFIKEIALINRAHNWDHSRVNPKTGKTEEYDDIHDGDYPSCYSGTKRRLFQSLIGHPLFEIVTMDMIYEELKIYLEGLFVSKIRSKIGIDGHSNCCSIRSIDDYKNAYTAWVEELDTSTCAILQELDIANTAQEVQGLQDIFTTSMIDKYGASFVKDPTIQDRVSAVFRKCVCTINQSAVQLIDLSSYVNVDLIFRLSVE